MTDTITIPRAVVEQALEALYEAHRIIVSGKSTNSQEWLIDEAYKNLTLSINTTGCARSSSLWKGSADAPCPKCAKAVEALRECLNTDDYTLHIIAREALAELENKK